MRFTYSSGSRPLEGYTIKRGIGIGGFGEVYFALNDAGKEVAIKKIQRHLDIELRGVRHCLNLKHVNLISLWDIRTNDLGENWVVMEYVPGPSLRDEIESAPRGMEASTTKHWFLSTASGVAYLHERGIVHRDLKPGNIFHDQDEKVIKIGDYGLSKFISHSRRSGQTEAVGTFHYMAPEIGKGVYGKEIDIYAMGIILFEMLTGNVPFDGESTNEIIMKHLTMDANLDIVPPEYKRAIEKSLRKDPQERYRNIGEMIRDLPWPEVSDGPYPIAAHVSVGPLPIEDAPSPQVITTADHPGETAPSDSIVEKLPPVVIDGREMEHPSDEGIRLGPLKDSSHIQRRAALQSRQTQDQISNAPWRDPQNGEGISFVDSPPSNVRHPEVVPEIADTDPYVDRKLTQSANPTPNKTLVATDQAVLTSHISSGSSEPIATAVRTGFHDLVRWWNSGKISAPVRLGVLVVIGIVVVQNSQQLLTAILVLVSLYLIYFAIRSYLLGTPLASGNTREWQILRTNEARLRDWLSSRPASDQVTEIVGAMLVSAIGAFSLSLLGMALVGFLDSTVQAWAVFTWQTLICIAAVWSIQLVSMNWSNKWVPFGNGANMDYWARVGVIVVTGGIIGVIAFFSASSFEIDLVRLATEDFATRKTGGWVFNLMPKLPAMMLAFAGLFSLVQLGRHTDRLRRTRLSVFNVLVALVMAAALSHLLNVPLTVLCVVAAVTTIAVQLASPWMHPDERLEVCRVQNKPTA